MHDPHGSKDSKTPAGAEGLRAFGKEASEPYIRARSASTSSSVVAQLVARRTIVWLS